MAMIDKRTGILLLVIAANLLANGALGLVARWGDTREPTLLAFATFMAPSGLLLGQMMLSAVWIACSAGSVPRRYGLPMLFVLAAGTATAVGGGGGWSGVLWIGLLLQFLLWTFVAVLFPLARLRGWRLAVDASRPERETNRFRIGDLLLWTALLAFPLAFLRIVFQPTEGATIAPGLAAMIAILVMMSPILWLGTAWALRPPTAVRSRTTAVIRGLYALLAIGGSSYALYFVARDLLWPLAGWLALLGSIGVVGVLLGCGLAGAALNGLALRRWSVFLS
jgi:hypothetical protein